jgi:hypothetical protein
VASSPDAPRNGPVCSIQPGFEASPKRSIEFGTVYLGGREVPVAALVSATLEEVFDEAWRQHDGTPPTVLMLTHPAAWPRPWVDVVIEAARAALPGGGRGIDIRTVAEPVAAAWHAVNSRRVPPTSRSSSSISVGAPATWPSSTAQTGS